MRRVDAALVLPLGLLACAAFERLGPVSGHAWLFPVLVLAVDATLLVPGPWRLTNPPPSLRGALPPFLAVVAVLALVEYPQNRRDASGGLEIDGALASDVAFQVGLAHELTQERPQTPGLAGVPLRHAPGSALVRAAALRYAGVPPLDSLTRFETTLDALALILALRAVARAVGGGPLGQALAGWSVLAADLAFLVPGVTGSWSGPFAGGAGLPYLLQASPLVPGLALALGALVSLQRHLVWEGPGYLALAVLLSAGLPGFAPTLAVPWLLGMLAALVLAVERPALAVVAGALALVVARGAWGLRGGGLPAGFEPLRIAESGLVLAALAWIVGGLGLRLVGLPAAKRALLSRRSVRATLAATAFLGYALGLALRLAPAGSAPGTPLSAESADLLAQSGFLLWIFAANTLGRLAKARTHPMQLVAAAALVALPSSVQVVCRKLETPPQRLSPAAVRSLGALERASRPADAVLVHPGHEGVPPPVLIGRRVVYARFLPETAWLAARESRKGALERATAFFETRDPGAARRIARELRASFVCLYEGERLGFAESEGLATVFEERGVRVYRLP